MYNIIKYKETFAKAIAEMWRKSANGWSGKYSDMTEEKVIKELNDSSRVTTFLIEKENEVLGYCDIRKYCTDALEIKLLNTRYDYHGKGIGKTLVLKAIEETAVQGYPRLDLMTWAGNEKSIPLYKKCGFFFISGDSMIYLTSFIPYVLTTEAVAEFFNEVDWYKDLKREIDMEPDGVNDENGFCKYEYKWEKNEKFLRMQFEKSGRGLTLLETDDYIFSSKIPEQQLVFGQSYTATYEVVNKTGKQLEIEMKGISNKHISIHVDMKKTVIERTEFEVPFFVEQCDEQIDSDKTHPVVATEIIINGKKANFKIGVKPASPILLQMRGTDAAAAFANRESYKNSNTKMYLDIGNNFDDEATFNFYLDDNDDIEFLNKGFEVSLMPNEKKSLEINCTIKNFHFYDEAIEVIATFRDGRKLEIKQRLTSVFKGREGKFFGEEKDYFVIVNGPFSAKLNKANNRIFLRVFENDNVYEVNRVTLNYVKIVKPCLVEFDSKVAKKVVSYEEGDSIIMKAVYTATEIENIEIVVVIKLSASGICEYYYEIFNQSTVGSSNPISILQGAYQKMANGVMPIHSKFVNICDRNYESIEHFNVNELTENWLFSSSKDVTRAMWWDPILKPKLDEWFLSFEHHISVLQPNTTVTTKPIKIALNTFKEWRECRDFVHKKSCWADEHLTDDLEITINEGNPFVKDELIVNVIEHKQKFLCGDFTARSKNTGESKKVALSSNDQLTKADLSIDLKNDYTIDVIQTEYETTALIMEKSFAVIKRKDTSVEKLILKEDGKRVYSFDNGLIKMKLSPEFSPGLCSLKIHDIEYLESAFPSAKAKSWYNPWVGGIYTAPEGLDTRSLLQEKVNCEFTTLTDQFQNEWQGIKTSLQVTLNEHYKGLQVDNYFLTLPGASVLCHIAEVFQNTGTYMNDELFETGHFFSINGELLKNYLQFTNEIGDRRKYKIGTDLSTLFIDRPVLIGNKEIDTKLQLFTNYHKVKPWFPINQLDASCFIFENITLGNKERTFTTPSFYVFTNEFIEERFLNLSNIVFKR